MSEVKLDPKKRYALKDVATGEFVDKVQALVRTTKKPEHARRFSAVYLGDTIWDWRKLWEPVLESTLPAFIEEEDRKPETKEKENEPEPEKEPAKEEASKPEPTKHPGAKGHPGWAGSGREVKPEKQPELKTESKKPEAKKPAFKPKPKPEKVHKPAFKKKGK